MTTITVIMPHIPRRDDHPFFTEARESVEHQTRPADQFIIERDDEHTGAAATLNRALEKVSGEWIAQMADDDFMLPNHLEVLEAHIDGADMLYPRCRTIGNDDFRCVDGFDGERLARGNYIPGGGSLIRTAAVRAVGGWCKPGDPDQHKYEDWVMWKRLYAAGYVLRHVPVETWCYRFGNHQTGGIG